MNAVINVAMSVANKLAPGVKVNRQVKITHCLGYDWAPGIQNGLR